MPLSPNPPSVGAPSGSLTIPAAAATAPAASKPRDREALLVRGLRKSFNKTPVLRGIDLLAREHEVVAILGSSGSGKSTLLRCINLLETPDSGEVAIGGELIRMRQSGSGRRAAPRPADRAQLIRLRARIGMVFQHFNLWAHLTALQNVTLAPMQVLRLPRAEAAAEGLAALERVGLAHRADAYPAELSGGQQQRVGIARALAMRPDLLLFDEPTSALDPELVGEVLKVMRALAEEGRTMLVVTHEMSFARTVANRVVFLHEGLVEEDGSPEQIFTAPRSDRVRRFLGSSKQERLF